MGLVFFIHHTFFSLYIGTARMFGRDEGRIEQLPFGSRLLHVWRTF
jgi:hypothetical protein